MRAMEAVDIGGSLVAEAANGDEVAFARIVATYHDDMVRVAFVVCRDAHMAQEAAHGAWPIAWRKLSTIRDPGKLKPWLLAIAANEARGLVRSQGRRRIRVFAIDPQTNDRPAPAKPIPPSGPRRSIWPTRSPAWTSMTASSWPCATRPGSRRPRSGRHRHDRRRSTGQARSTPCATPGGPAR